MTYFTKETFSGMSAWLRVVFRATAMYSCQGCILHKVAIPARGAVCIISSQVCMFVMTRFWQMAVKRLVLSESRYHHSFLTEKCLVLIDMQTPYGILVLGECSYRIIPLCPSEWLLFSSTKVAASTHENMGDWVHPQLEISRQLWHEDKQEKLRSDWNDAHIIQAK